MKLLNNRVVIRPILKEISKHGIHLPNAADKRTQTGSVVLVSEGKLVGEKVVPLDVKAGDKVLYHSFSAEQLTVDGWEDCVLVSDDSILAVL